LPHRQVHLVAGALLERKVAHVSDNTNHAPLFCASAEDVLANRILPGQSVRAIVSLIMMTGSVVGVSLGEMSRPARSGIPIAAGYPSVTTRTNADGFLPRS
jgi:hypothetical protein